MASEPQKLSEHAAAILVDPGNELLLSAASAWEIAIKHALGRLDLLDVDPQSYVPEQRALLGIEPLPIDEIAATHVGRLPELHHDPFDRILVAQAIVEGLTLVTPDPLIARYPIRTLW